MRLNSYALVARTLCAWSLAALAILLSACGGGSSSASAITGPVGTTTGVAMTTSTKSSQIQQGANFVVTATVTSDVNNAGVTWALTGGGTLTNITTSTVTYTAPTGITGITTPTLTATSIADATKSASGTLVVLGTPVIDATTLFPGNVSSAYGAALNVSGGLAPYAWALNSGTLPPGITLGTSTTAFTSISGTPTAAGNYVFQIKVTDANSNVSTVDLTMTVNAAEACLLNGQFALLYTGFISNAPVVSASSLNISAGGAIAGLQDFNLPDGAFSESISGTCTTRTANNGTLTITGAKQSPTYDYAVTTSLASGRMQLINGGDSKSGSGLFLKQDPTAFSLPVLAGNYAFGAHGNNVDNSHIGIAGVISIDAGGVITGGRADANDTSALTAGAVSGTLSAPDSNGRGTLSLTLQTSGGSATDTFTYFVVDANKLLIIGNDGGRWAGFMTRQNGSFDNTSLASPAVLSLWGAFPAALAPKSVLTLGHLGNANAGTGKLDLKLDKVDKDTSTLDAAITGASYAVDSDGRATLGFSDGGVARSFAIYLDGAANGYVVEHGSGSGNAGLLEAQFAAPFSNTIPGLFVGGTQYAQDVAPLVMLPAVHLASGSLSSSSNYASGFYALDTASGRGIGTLTITGSGQGIFTLYVIGPNKVVLMRLPAKSRSATIEWLGN